MRILFFAFFILLAGCSGGFGTMDRIMSSWEGAQLDDVISQWGYPHGKQEFGGRTIYFWDRNVSWTPPATMSGTATQIGNTTYFNATAMQGGTINGSCRRTLEVDSRGYVVGWQWSGNNCPFADIAMGYQNWERKNKTKVFCLKNGERLPVSSESVCREMKGVIVRDDT